MKQETDMSSRDEKEDNGSMTKIENDDNGGRVRKRSRRSSDEKKTKRDFTADIDKLKNAKDREEEAVEEARKLRGEIEQQIEKSFEMIEERQSEVIGYLKQREREEEEHKRRAADIVKRLENGMTNTEDAVSNGSPTDRQSYHREGILDLDSKYVQTENNPLLISKFGGSINSGLNEPRSGPWRNQEIKLNDVPDVIEAIKDDLIENVKMQLADRAEAIDELQGSQSVNWQTPSYKNRGGRLRKTNSRLNEMVAEIAKAVVRNELRRGNENKDLEKSLEGGNSELELCNSEDIFSHRDQIEHGLRSGKPNIHEVPGISSEGREKLKVAYGRMRKDFDNLAQLILGGRTADELHVVNNESLSRCRELCRDIDDIENIIHSINEEIDRCLGRKSSMHSHSSNMTDILQDKDKALKENSATAVALVAKLSDEDGLVNLLYAHTQIPAMQQDEKQLHELLNRKMDADKKMNSKLDDLSVMLGQGGGDAFEVASEGKETLEEKQTSLDMDNEMGDSQLKDANVRLQRELDSIYKANRDLIKENEDLRERLHATRQDGELGSILRQSEYNDLDILQWESEKKMKQKLDEIKDKIGDEMFNELLASLPDAGLCFDDLQASESMRLEKQTLQSLLQRYKDTNESLKERLTNADVADDIGRITTIANHNTNKVLEDLQKEAAKTDEMIRENGKNLAEKETLLKDIGFKRNDEMKKEEELWKEKIDLEKRLAEINNMIHTFFPLKDKEKKAADIERRLAEIDEEIDILAKELMDKSDEASDGVDERPDEVERLYLLLEKLKPHVKSGKKIQIRNDKDRSSEIPKEMDVDEAIRSKLELTKYLIDSRRPSGKEQVKMQIERETGVFTEIEREYDDLKKLEKLKTELKTIVEEIGDSQADLEDGAYLMEVVSSLRVSLEDANKDLEDARGKSERMRILNQEIEDIEQKLEELGVLLKDSQSVAMKKTDDVIEDGRLYDDEVVTRRNAKEKVQSACMKLEHEKERLQKIIEATENLEKERSISTLPDVDGFQQRFKVNTEKLMSEIEECLDDVERVLDSAKDTLATEHTLGSNGKEDKELKERNEKLTRLNGNVEQLSHDLDVIDNFNRDGEPGEIADSDLEELIYKIEAISVSIERMNRTIEDHRNKDGDAKTLETLLKRKEKMTDSQEGIRKEIDRRKAAMERDLLEYLNEKSRLEAEVAVILGDGEINSNDERLAILEMIDSVKANRRTLSSDSDNELRDCLIQRQKVADDYEDFQTLGGLTEDDGEFLSKMIESVELDIEDRLGEINLSCKGYNAEMLYEKAYLKSMMKNRADLQSALHEVREQKKNIQKKHEKGTESAYRAGYKTNNYKELNTLAATKIQAINKKLNVLDSIIIKKHFKNDLQDFDEDNESADSDKNEVDGLIEEIGGELSSLQEIDKFEEDWSGVTATLLDEINHKIDMDDQINRLFDERGQLIEGYLSAERNDGEGSEKKNYSSKISDIDQRILSHWKLSVDDQPTAHSSPTVAFDEQDDTFKLIFDERDFTVRQLFALRTRESGRKYNKNEIKAIEGASSLKPDLEKKLKELDAKIMHFNGNKTADIRTESPNLYAMMKMIDDEIEKLKEEVDEKKLFLYGKKIIATEEAEVTQQSSHVGSSEEEEIRGEKKDDIKEQIHALSERRDELILASEAQEDHMSEEEIIERQSELEAALKEAEKKITLLEKRKELENEIAAIESVPTAVAKQGKEDDKEKENLRKDLDAVENRIAKYFVAVEDALKKADSLQQMSREIDLLMPDDQREIQNLLKGRLDELIKERIKLDLEKEKLSIEFKDNNELQDLIDERKDVIKKLNEKEGEIMNRSKDTSLANRFVKERQEYEEVKRRQNFLQKKKEEIQNFIGHLESQKESSFEDTTSGFSDNVEIDERNNEIIHEKEREIWGLKQEIEKLRRISEKALSELDEERTKTSDLNKENNDKNQVIEKLEVEMTRLQKEIDDLNDAAEAMMDVANAMEEQNHAKSLEVELNRDQIMELEKQLKVAQTRDWHGMEANFDAIEKRLVEKSQEVDELILEKDKMAKEMDILKEECRQLKKQLEMLDKLKDELKRKGKRVVKLDKDEFYTVSPTEENLIEDGRKSNDFRNEIDKVSAVEEVMKLAAEMTSENERLSNECKDLESQKEELTQILEDLLEKCQAQSEEIECLEKKIKGNEEIKLKNNEYEAKEKENEIIAVESRLLMEEADYSVKEENDDLTTSVMILSNEKEQLKYDLEEMQSKIAVLKDDLKSKEAMLKSAESQIEELMGTARSLIAKNGDLEAKIMKEEKMRKERDDEAAEQLLRKEKEIIDMKNIAEENRGRADKLELEKQKFEHEFILKSTKNDFLLKQIQDLENEKDDVLKDATADKRKLENRIKVLLHEKEKIGDRLEEKIGEFEQLNNKAEIMKVNHRQKEAKYDKEINLLKMGLEEANNAYDEMQVNFDRMKKAKEKMMVDYEKQIKGLLNEITTLRNIEGSLQEELKRKEDNIKSMVEKLRGTKEELVENNMIEMDNLLKEQSNELMDERRKRKKVESDLEKQLNEAKRVKQRIKQIEEEQETKMELFQEEINKLTRELQKRDNKLKELEAINDEFDIEENRFNQQKESRKIRRQYENELLQLNLELEQSSLEKASLLEKLKKMKESLEEKEKDLANIENEFQNEIREIRKKTIEKEYWSEQERLMDKMKGADTKKSLNKYKKESLERNVQIAQLNEDKLKLKEELKDLEEMIMKMKERHGTEKKSRDLRIEELEGENLKLEDKMKRIHEKLVTEIEEGNKLKSIESECMKLRAENMVYNETLVKLSENSIYKEKAENAEKELANVRGDFDKLKNESIQILKYSTATKNEIKKLKQQLAEVKRENRKEQKLLITNLENEFRKKIEEIIKSNIQEKEKMLKMWDEERENWESDMNEDMETSRHEFERQLRLQKADLENKHVNKLAEVMNENKTIINELNGRLNELERERLQMEKKFDEETRKSEHLFIAEKEYMIIIIREMLKNLIDSKSRKSIMNENHKNEITDMEEKFEKEKIFMDMRLKEELQLLRQRVNKLLSRDDDQRAESLLDLIPRKLSI